MCAKWRILLKSIETSDRVSDLIVKAICCLHNFLIDQKSLNPGALADTGLSNEDNGAWRTCVPDPLRSAQIRSKKANHSRNNALKVQNVLIEYFNSAGIVDWQENMI
ncbi:protein ALP1-like [Ditylenchus destructor]|uniref:Protein ALP1-like n=1 Tax=Ditylenchus destructor TaxID=166010 RepID=A0AAD4MHH6_9BILA|nr:protein ALP1-like [Ditylenchus destructor]